MANNKKIYTVKEVDESNLGSYMEGYADCYTLLDEAVGKLQTSVENIQAIYYIGDVAGKQRPQVQELGMVISALNHLRDIMNVEYFDSLEEMKPGSSISDYAELRESLGL